MSLSQRINKLEQKHSRNSWVVYPVLLDASGQKFTECSNKSQISSVSFKCDGQELRVTRNTGEAYDAFQGRSTDEAKAHFDCIVVLHFDVA